MAALRPEGGQFTVPSSTPRADARSSEQVRRGARLAWDFPAVKEGDKKQRALAELVVLRRAVFAMFGGKAASGSLSQTCVDRLLTLPSSETPSAEPL